MDYTDAEMNSSKTNCKDSQKMKQVILSLQILKKHQMYFPNVGINMENIIIIDIIILILNQKMKMKQDITCKKY